MIDDSHFKVDLTIEGSDFKSTKKHVFIHSSKCNSSFFFYLRLQFTFVPSRFHAFCCVFFQWLAMDKKINSDFSDLTTHIDQVLFFSLCKHRRL